MSAFRVMWLLAGVSLRRFINRIARRKKSKKRTGTGRKSTRSPVMLALFAVLMLFNSLGMCSRGIGMLASAAEERTPAPVRTEREDAIGLGGGEDLPDIEVTRRTVRRMGKFLPSAESWPVRGERDVVTALGLVLTVLMLALVFMGLGSGNVELSQVGWSLEWLYTFPIATRSLFFARIGEYAVTNIFAWLTVFPLLWVAYGSAGFGWFGLPLALVITLLVNGVIASARLTAETMLRKRLSLHRLKNFQALFTIVGILLFFVVITVFTGRAELLLDVAEATPTGALAQPLSSPLLFCFRSPTGLVFVAWAAVLISLFLGAAVREVRTGLVTTTGGPHQGKRGKPEKPASNRPLTLLGKEVQLLLRDRNFLAQTFVIPILLLGYWMVTGVGESSGDWGPATSLMVAFIAGAYVLMYGGFSILMTETSALWLLYTFPRPLDRLLRSKVILWGHTAALFTLALGAYYVIREGGAPLLPAAMALGGVYLMAVLAGAMGVMGTDPFEKEARRKMRPEWMYLYMLIVASYAFGIKAPSLWSRVGVLVLTGLLAVALWDRVRERLPLLLDPTATPTPRITLSDGVVAALAFLQLQVMLRLALTGAAPGTQIVVPFFAAGAVTVLFALYILWRSGIRPLFPAVGLGGDALRPGAIGLGAGVGAACAALAHGYLWLLDHFDALRHLKEQAVLGAELKWALAAVAIIGAPIVEEFVFRGLLYQGMRRVTGPRLAIIGSAVVFAVVHPAISFVPVFTLGVACAIVFARTRSLWAPIALHAVYNAAVVLA